MAGSCLGSSRTSIVPDRMSLSPVETDPVEVNPVTNIVFLILVPQLLKKKKEMLTTFVYNTYFLDYQLVGCQV